MSSFPNLLESVRFLEFTEPWRAPPATRPATVGSAPSPTRKSAMAGRLASTVPSSRAAARASPGSSASRIASSGFSACSSGTS